MQSHGSAVIKRIVARSAAEQAELQALEQRNGLSSLAVHPSRFPIYQAISQRILTRSLSDNHEGGRADQVPCESIGAAVLVALREADILGGGDNPAFKDAQEGGSKQPHAL